MQMAVLQKLPLGTDTVQYGNIAYIGYIWYINMGVCETLYVLEEGTIIVIIQATNVVFLVL